MATIPIYNPQTPFLGLIPNGIRPGITIRVKGQMHSSGSRFSIHLQCGAAIRPRDDVAFDLSVRPHEHCIVRNHAEKEVWGSEERFGGCPIGPGQNYDILILAEDGFMKVAINNSHFCQFSHRIPIFRIQFISIDGDTSIQFIGIEGDQSGAVTAPGFIPPTAPVVVPQIHHHHHQMPYPVFPPGAYPTTVAPTPRPPPPYTPYAGAPMTPYPGSAPSPAPYVYNTDGNSNASSCRNFIDNAKQKFSGLLTTTPLSKYSNKLLSSSTNQPAVNVRGYGTNYSSNSSMPYPHAVNMPLPPVTNAYHPGGFTCENHNSQAGYYPVGANMNSGNYEQHFYNQSQSLNQQQYYPSQMLPPYPNTNKTFLMKSTPGGANGNGTYGLAKKKKSNKALKYAAGIGGAGLGVYALSRAFGGTGSGSEEDNAE